MSESVETQAAGPSSTVFGALTDNWGWQLGLGLLFVVMGAIGLYRAIGLPLDHGINMLPSGHFPFCRIKFAGSFVAGICARFTALRNKSFIS